MIPPKARPVENPCDVVISEILHLEFPDKQSFSAWLSSENKIEWCLRKPKKAPKKIEKHSEASATSNSKRGRPATIEWAEEYRCPFSGTPRIRSKGTAKRVASKPSRKVGCKASIKAQKMFCDSRIYVLFENCHSGHTPRSMETYCRPRLSPVVSRWLQKVVATGIDWTTFKQMTRPEGDKLGLLDRSRLDISEPIEISDILRITNQDFNNIRRKFFTQNPQLQTAGFRRDADTEQSSLRNQITKPSHINYEAAKESSNDREFAVLMEQIESIIPSISGISHITNAQLEDASALLAQATILKRSFEAHEDDSWSRE
ncbi:hypothetical protein OnM2_048062 [Erysiphe neolycopersici]|uniref:Uncharacterized protein n=1 Tax=Erysiphe neolycopersici TaxID=212602 RepID=A0A420HTA9_9PEZI|nr:hypothetical protein OnM2_048062 [Erysiphe neolycopersici]